MTDNSSLNNNNKDNYNKNNDLTLSPSTLPMKPSSPKIHTSKEFQTSPITNYNKERPLSPIVKDSFLNTNQII